MIGLIRGASLTHYAEVARHAGLDPCRMLSEFGLPPRCLKEPELMVPIDAVRRLLEASAERSGVEGFGLLMAEARRLSNLGPLGLLIREQPTLRLALEAFVRYGNRLNEALFLTIEESRRRRRAARGTDRRRLGIGAAVDRARDRRGVPDAAHVPGPEWRPRRVCFAHDAPADRSIHERVFGRNVEFGHDFNGIVCARADLEVVNPDADPVIARLARQMLEANPASKPPNMTIQVRELVVMLLGTGTCTIDRVAQHLGVDRRTIHRHLANEGKTFSRSGRGRAAGARRALRQGSAPVACGGFIAARLLGAERVLPLVPSAIQDEALGAARAPRETE